MALVRRLDTEGQKTKYTKAFEQEVDFKEDAASKEKASRVGAHVAFEVLRAQIATLSEQKKVINQLNYEIHQSVRESIMHNPSVATEVSEDSYIITQLSQETVDFVETHKNKTTTSYFDRLLEFVDTRHAHVLQRSIRAFFELIICAYVSIPYRRKFGRMASVAWWCTFLAHTVYNLVTKYPDLVNIISQSDVFERFLNRLEASPSLSWLVSGIRFVISKGPSFVFYGCTSVMTAYFTGDIRPFYNISLWFLNSSLQMLLSSFVSASTRLLQLGQAIISGHLTGQPKVAAAAVMGVLLRLLCGQFEKSSWKRTACKVVAQALQIPAALSAFQSGHNNLVLMLSALYSQNASQLRLRALCNLHGFDDNCITVLREAQGEESKMLTLTVQRFLGMEPSGNATQRTRNIQKIALQSLNEIYKSGPPESAKTALTNLMNFWNDVVTAEGRFMQQAQQQEFGSAMRRGVGEKERVFIRIPRHRLHPAGLKQPASDANPTMTIPVTTTKPTTAGMLCPR